LNVLPTDYGVRRGDRLSVVAAGEELRAYAVRPRGTTAAVEATEMHTQDVRAPMAMVQAAESLLDEQLYTTRPFDAPHAAPAEQSPGESGVAAGWAVTAGLGSDRNSRRWSI
jgi:hypothetical protein